MVASSVQTDTSNRWGTGFRVFLSYNSTCKEEAAKLKGYLEEYGIAAFLAHQDINPTQLWEEEIKKALGEMQAFVPLLTSDFHESKWTDQETGYAVCRGVTTIPLRLDVPPYGFIGRIQALSSGWYEAPLEIVKILLSKEQQVVDGYIRKLWKCRSFNEANRLFDLLQCIQRLTRDQAAALVDAYNQNDQVRGSFAFNGSKPHEHGPGLIPHLRRLTETELVDFTTRGEDIVMDDPPF